MEVPLSMGMNSEMVEPSLLGGLEEQGAAQRHSGSGKSESAAYPRECSTSDPKVPTASFLHSFDTQGPVPHPVLGPEDTVINKWAKITALLELTALCRNRESTHDRKKMHPQLKM